MTPHIPEEFSTRLIDWSRLVIMSNTMPPRDPDEDEEDEEEEDSADGQSLSLRCAILKFRPFELLFGIARA
jgi:hypothetical protein